MARCRALSLRYAPVNSGTYNHVLCTPPFYYSIIMLTMRLGPWQIFKGGPELTFCKKNNESKITEEGLGTRLCIKSALHGGGGGGGGGGGADPLESWTPLPAP